MNSSNQPVKTFKENNVKKLLDLCQPYISEISHALYVGKEIERANNPERESTLRATIEDVKRLRREHFLLKDMVLEEVLPKYRGIINYDKIFQLYHTFPGVIEKIKEIAETGAFDGVFIVSHYNSAREAEAKLRFFKKYLPMVRVILVKFHQDEFVLGNDQFNQARQRTNKVNDFRIQTGIDDYSLTSFIDDSISIIDEAIELGVRHCLHKKKKDKTLALLDIAFANDTRGLYAARPLVFENRTFYIIETTLVVCCRVSSV